MVRRKSGDETWHRLKDWTKGSKEAERLAFQVLRYEDYKLLDPSHPLGGPDQGKDLICYKGDTKFLIAVSFSKNQLSWSKIRQKFKDDFDKLSSQKGFVFFTNQEITVKKREELKEFNGKIDIEIYHLERISQVVNSPSCYGIRLEFLDIEMTKEEQISFINSRDSVLNEISDRIEEVIEENQSNIPTEELREFQSILNQITGFSSHSFGAGLYNEGLALKLRVPLNELKEFKEVLHSIAGNSFNTASIWGNPIDKLTVPINQLKEFQKILEGIVGPSGQNIHTSVSFLNDHPINRLNVPLQQLIEYEKRLDRIIEKKKEIE